MARTNLILGTSGGVDSSVAAILLKEQGYSVVGVTLVFPKWDNSDVKELKHSASVLAAKKVCEKLGIPHFVYDANALFKDKVVDYFHTEYASGRTPNPCVVCNRFVKFHALLSFAQKKGVKLVATGHYAIIRKNTKTGENELLRGADAKKDQSYYLSYLPQEYISRMILPLGEHTKKEVYSLAKKYGLTRFKPSDQSQDFCYLSGTTTEKYLKQNLPQKSGPIVDAETGKAVGEHTGLAGYTIGQRRKIKLGGGPYYVLKVQPPTLIVTRNLKLLESEEVTLNPFSLTSGKTALPANNTKVEAQVRYQAKPVPSVVSREGENLKVRFEQPVRAIAPGQLCALYRGDICIGGGFIT